MRRILPWLLLTAVALSEPLAGQAFPIPDSGSRVRIWTATGGAAGQLVRLSGDSVFLQAGPTSPVRGWPRAGVARLEISRGRRGHFWLGLGIGTAVGLGAGIAVGQSSSDQLGAGAAGLMVWAGGMVVGGMVGALVKTERWGPAALPPTEERVDAVAQSPAPPD